MFFAATGWLERSAQDIDALNVYPVPDGDTGTNMLLTMRSTIEEAEKAAEDNTSAVAVAMARGALTGARGNSGVILSQIFRGLAKAMGNKEAIDGLELAKALEQGSIMAYRALTNPVEGTILTVAKEAASAALAQASTGANDIVSVMEAAVSAAREAVANTPALLPVLRESGVVDAGGQGLYTILDGALRYLKGQTEEMQYRKLLVVASNVAPTGRIRSRIVEVPYGYCTELILKGRRLDPERIKAQLDRKGQSLMVVGDENAVRVHIHTDNPGGIIRYATIRGTLHNVSIRNMDEQYKDFLEMQRERMPELNIGVVAVASGDGLADVFRSLGAAAVVSGGQTMNPSTRDLAEAVESANADYVIILPNNKNVIPVAQQVQALTKKKVAVVPTRTIPEGISALLALDYEADFKTNTELMTKAKSAVKSISVTRAMRSTQLGGLKIRKRQFISFLNGDLVAVGDVIIDVLNETLSRLPLGRAEVVTIYYGDGVGQAEAEEIGHNIRERYPNVQVEVVWGGQPNYKYIISVE